MKNFPALVLTVAILSLNGCASGPQTVKGRIQEKSSAFVQFTPRELAMIQRGLIATDFTPGMVYMALDKPDQVITGPGPQQETWYYTSYYAADGASQLGGQRIVTHWAQDSGSVGGTGGTNGRMPGAMPSAPFHAERNTFTVEYDPGLFQEKTQTTRRVRVIFLFGRVAGIQLEAS